MARETKAQRTARVSALLADYDARSRELRKMESYVKDLKAQIRELDTGLYGDWSYEHGTPREILDQKEARKRLTDRGIPVPMAMTEAPIVVRTSVFK